MAATLFLRKKAGRFMNRTAGYQLSKKVWTCRACRAWHDAPKPSRCQVCNHPEFLFFDSAGEARYFVGLLRSLDQQIVTELLHHPHYPINIFGVDGVVEVFHYVADFEYLDHAAQVVTGDFKPKSADGLDPVFKLKRKCFEAQYGRAILVVTEV